MSDYATLLEEVKKRQVLVKEYLFAPENRLQLTHQHLSDAAVSYLKAGGKSLRPGVLMFACGAVGGDEKDALPAAAAVELYHTWTLVHDDIIDRDDLRRGSPTVHVEFAERAREELGFDKPRAAHYGLAIGILAGDLQQGWCISLLSNLYRQLGLPPDLVINLQYDLFNRIQTTLVDGEALDVLYSETPIEDVNPDKIIDMLWKKTGVLYDFAGRAGAAIGLRQADIKHPDVERIATYTGRCGTAFQIQDDILGVVGDEKQLGKPVGSDIKEGKRTLVVLGALPNMSEAEREFAMRVLGNDDATPDEIQELIGLLESSGGIQFAKDHSRQMIEEALDGITALPESEPKDLLKAWGNYLIEREF